MRINMEGQGNLFLAVLFFTINDVFLSERTFLSHRREMTEKRPQVLKNIFNYCIAILY